MKKEDFKICIVGAGNISNTRHIPGILKNKLNLYGVISNSKDKIDRTKIKFNIKNTFLLDKDMDYVEQLRKCEWLLNVDAVIIGAPPRDHFLLTKAFLILGKHVLTEKPMMMNEEECDEVIKIAEENNLILNVMHSFNFATNFLKMEKEFKQGKYGVLRSIVEIQFTNRDRRLPEWYNDLPLGLFYDEAAHFFYTAINFGNGPLEVVNAHCQKNENENTPRLLEVQARSGDIPVQMLMNFDSPICEWTTMLVCDKKIAIYDFFKDILIVLDNDNQHVAKDVLRTSINFTTKFWKGFIINGFKMVTGNLLYGHDLAIQSFINSIISGKKNDKLDAKIGKDVVKAMNMVCKKCSEDR